MFNKEITLICEKSEREKYNVFFAQGVSYSGMNTTAIAKLLQYCIKCN